MPQRLPDPFQVPLTKPLHGFPQGFGVCIRVEVTSWAHGSFQLQEAQSESAGVWRPPRGQARRGACEGGEAFPKSPKPSSLGEKAGVKAQQTDSCPRAETGRRRETDPGLGAGQVLSRGNAIGCFLEISKFTKHIGKISNKTLMWFLLDLIYISSTKVIKIYFF